MTGFPLEWRDEQLGPPGDGCPVSQRAISSYLESGAYYLLKDEPPLTFGPLSLVLHRVIQERGFWIWTCVDRNCTPWFVMVLSASVTASPSVNDKRCVFAETQENRTPEEFLQDTLNEMGAETSGNS